MATTVTVGHGLIDLANQTANGNLIQVAEELNQTNPILSHIPFKQSNSIIGEKISRRVSLPTGTWRKLNQGVAAESSKTESVIETIGLLEAESKLDEEEVDLAPDADAYRSVEDLAFVEGLGQSMASALFYGNLAAHPERFNGFLPRLNALSQANVYDGGGSSSYLTSIYLVKWGITRVYGIVPRGMPTGLQIVNQGKQRVTDSSGNAYRAYVTQFKWHVGLAVKDERAIRRIANIETTGSANTFSDDMLLKALNAMPGNQGGERIYVSPTLKTQMDIWAKDKSNVSYTSNEVGGIPVTKFRGVPVHQVDAILDTEEQVS